jgi:hypothetical protein
MKALLVLILLFSVSVAAAAEKTTRVVGSVSDILIARPPHLEFVEIFLRIHSPSDLSGTTLVLITNTRDRGRVRSQMPLGSLYEVTLPESTCVDLKRQREHQERFEKSVDQGTPPEIISDAVELTQIRLADLPVPLAPFPLKP